jgi:hypothetical protein
VTAIHIADTGLFAAIGQPSNERYQVVRAFARQHEITFVLPELVYEELTVNASDDETRPIDTAIESGWARIAAPIEYRHALVSRVMDGVQRYIANADDRPEDEIEGADPALAGVAAQAFLDGTADHAYIYTTDRLAGEGAEAVFASEGYPDSITYVNGFRFVDDLLE